MLDSESNKKKPTVEDLLRVKRAEQPSEEFWRRFDRDLEKKIVRSVVRRDTAVSEFFRWIYARGKVFAAGSCVLLGAFLLLSKSSVPSDSPPSPVVSQPAPAATEVLEKVDTWSSSDAPSLAGADQNFVIEVLSSGAGPAAGAGRSWMGGESEQGSNAYYVADQLSSTEQGWSGERLPF